MTKLARLLCSCFAMVVVGVSAPATIAQQGHSPNTSTPAPVATMDQEQGSSWQVAEIQVVDLDGSPVTMSPDGRWLAGLGPDLELCVWEIASLEPTCDEPGPPIYADSIVWSPDSTAVAFALDAFISAFESDIYVFELASGTSANLTDDGVEGRLFGGEDVPSRPVDVAPTWTDDSQSVIFARSDLAAEASITDLMTIARAGGEPELLATVHDTPLVVFTRMHSLADGSLLYTLAPSDLSDTSTGLWMLSPEGDTSQVLPGSGATGYPVPVVTSIVESNGSALVAGYSLTNLSRFPDTTSLAFVVDLGSGDVTPLVGDPDTFQTPGPTVLSPDGATTLSTLFGPTEGDQVLLAGEQQEEIELGPGGQSTFRPNVVRGGPEWRSGNVVFIPSGLTIDPYILTMTQVTTA